MRKMKRKKIFGAFMAIIVVVSFAFIGKEKYETLEVGANAPMTDYKMPDVSGKELTLKEIKKQNGLLVVFSCNTCPFVVGSEDNKGWEGRYNLIASECEKYDIGMVLVNSNEAKRDQGDSMEDMKLRAKEKGFKSYYALDANSELANAFGAKTTPHVFLFDADLKLAYRGAIDDNHRDPEIVSQNYLLAAIDNVASGEEIEVKETKAIGCSIKRVKQ